MLWILQTALALSYPFLVWTGLSHFEPRQVGWVVLLFLALRFAIARPSRAAAAARALWLPAAATGLIVGAVLIWNDPLGLLMMPAAISFGFLASFLFSLRGPEPMVERFARLQVDSLSPDEVAYCRRVTWVWCGFFLLNGSVAAGLAAARQIDAWALYTGFVAYLFTGMLFASEFLYRHWRFRRYAGGFLDPILKRIFPPHSGGAQ